MSPDLSFETKQKQRRKRVLVLLTFLYSIRSVFMERVYADKFLKLFWFVRSSSSQHHSKYTANIATENVSQVRSTEYKTRSFICKLNPNFLRSSRRFNCDTAFAVIVSLLNKSVHDFNNILNESLETGFQTVKIRRL